LTLVSALLVIQLVVVGGRAPHFTRAAAPGAPTVYGADDARMLAAVHTAGWPQQVQNWCGVATVAAIADYRGGGVSQGGVAGYLNSSAAVSPWGTPSFIYPGPGFRADIARDAGTDPRSLAAGLAALAGGRYHALADPWGAWDATYHLAADIEYSGQPVSVIVDHGLHSVVVSKVFANGDPATDPGSIYALEVWDPGFGSAFDAQIQGAQRVQVPLGDWLYDDVYWGAPYYQNGVADPDPAVGPYTYNPNQGEYNQTWIGNWVYIQPWGPTVSVDWTVNALDTVVPGQHGELPPGYVLPTPTPTPTPPGRDGRAAPAAPPPSPTPLRRGAAVPQSTSGAASNPDDAAPPETIAPPLVLPPPGATWCLGPYCLERIDPLWLGTSGGLLALALLLLASALWARRRARAHAAAPGLSLGSHPPGPARAPARRRGQRKAAPAPISAPALEALAQPDMPAPTRVAPTPRVVPVLAPASGVHVPAEPAASVDDPAAPPFEPAAVAPTLADAVAQAEFDAAAVAP
jgi:hypothetical protein